MKESWNRYKSVISYLFFGVCTTAVNIIVYYLCARMLKMGTAEQHGGSMGCRRVVRLYYQ